MAAVVAIRAQRLTTEGRFRVLVREGWGVTMAREIFMAELLNFRRGSHI